MAISSLVFAPPVRHPARTAHLDHRLFEEAVAVWDGGDHAGALERVLRHLLPGREVPQGIEGTLALRQGSSRVTLRWDTQEVRASVPLVRLAPGGSTAALRFILEKHSGAGQLHQPRLRGDDLTFEYRERLERLHPVKLLEVLRRMPVEADASDDWIVDQFGATLLEREPVEALGDDEVARAWDLWRLHWNEVEELLKEVQRKRSVFFLDMVSAYTVHRLRSALPLVGSLSARLAEAAGVFNRPEEDPSRRESSLARCLKAMKAVAAPELNASLGHAEYCISPLTEGTPQVLAGWLGAGEQVEAVEQARATGKALEAAVALFSTYYFLLARFTWPEAVENGLVQGLAEASGRPWRDAANVLVSRGKALVATFEEATEAATEGAQEPGSETVEVGP
jgi:hypothetical protein